MNFLYSLFLFFSFGIMHFTIFADQELAYLPYDIYYDRPESEIFLPGSGRILYSYPSYRQPIYNSILLVKSNLPEARWQILEQGKMILTGQGSTSEVHLIPGLDYQIKPEDYEGYELTISPSSNFVLSEGEIFTLELRYRRTYGRIAIEANIPSGETIDILLENDNLQRPIRQKISSLNNLLSWKSTFLPSGKYFLTINTPSYFESIHPFFIEIKEGQTTTVKLKLQATRSIQVNTNYSEALFFLKSNKDKKIYNGQGSNFNFNHLLPGTYSLTFKSNDPNFTPPPPKQINISSYNIDNPSIFVKYTTKVPEKEKIIPIKKQETEEKIKNIDLPLNPLSQLLKVPAGMTILGDPFKDNTINTDSEKKRFVEEFYIGKFEITNSQFALWLNKALKEKSIIYSENGPHAGIVFDLTGKILFKTTTAQPESQIYTTKLTNKEISFHESPGKGAFPVIFVSWFGAKQYCADYNCRLPTEVEWEKAAGMAINSDKLLKYKYGFSKNTIDRSLANYKSNDNSLSKISVNTTPVGFYNGINLLPLTNQDTSQIQTQNAISPIGAYDMSGNVWEFVDHDIKDSSKVKIIAKGGCYDSLKDGVRVAERIELSKEHVDQFTGFRVAK